MGLVITGSGIDSAECRELRVKWRERVQQYDDMDAMLVFDTEDAFIEYQNNGRSVVPHLTLMGRPVSVEGEFPWDVSGVEYANKLDRQLMAYRYELTRENLSALAAKGMFEPGFETPEVLRKNRFELPCTVSCVAIGPESESDFPVVFVSLNPGSLVCDDRMSGYTIDEYFDMLPEAEPEDLVYESAVARTLPYENAFNKLGDQLRVSEMPVPESAKVSAALERAMEPVTTANPALADKPAEADKQPDVDKQDRPGKADRPAEAVFDGKAGDAVGTPASARIDLSKRAPVVPVPVEEPVPEAKPVEPETKLDRKSEVSKMGGPDAEDEEGFFSLDSGDEFE